MPHLWLTHGEYIDKPSTFQQSVYIYIGNQWGIYRYTSSCSPLASLVPSPGVGHRPVLGAGRLSAAVTLERGPGSPGKDALRAARRGTDAPGAMKKSGDLWGEPVNLEIYICLYIGIYIYVICFNV